MKNTIVINVVGLTHELIGEHTPFLSSFEKRAKIAYIKPVLPESLVQHKVATSPENGRQNMVLLKMVGIFAMNAKLNSGDNQII